MVVARYFPGRSYRLGLWRRLRLVFGVRILLARGTPSDGVLFDALCAAGAACSSRLARAFSPPNGAVLASGPAYRADGNVDLRGLAFDKKLDFGKYLASWGNPFRHDVRAPITARFTFCVWIHEACSARGTEPNLPQIGDQSDFEEGSSGPALGSEPGFFS